MASWRRLSTLLWRELESLFFSPIAYIVLTIFLVLNGVAFITSLQLSGGVVSSTIALFLGDGPFFWISLMIVPALVTMRLVAEERRSGTLEVLLTAPVHDGEVIVAKFLGALLFQVFLWTPTLLYIAIIRRYGALPDEGRLVTSYLGIFCVTSMLTALGVFFSTLSSNQIIAAVGALTANLILLFVPAVTGATRIAYVERAMRGISMFEHFATSFSRGLIDTGVLAWYFAATAGFLLLATRSLEVRKWR